MDLTNDCFRFVTGSFEVISLSASHIYHSALPLSPKISIVRKLYEPQAKPLARVVHGLPDSWDPSITNTKLPDGIATVTWSPCSQFIAITQELSSKIVILDAVTLEQLHTMQPQDLDTEDWSNLIYSLDGHLLTAYCYDKGLIVSWDLQTGGLISDISTGDGLECRSILYSRCGTMLGGLFESNTIIIYNVLSGIEMSSHSVPRSVHHTIWTHGECLQFATVESGFITIWEVSFASTNVPTQISSLPIPDNLSLREFVLLPTLYQLAFIVEGRVLVWDAQHQRILLDSIDVKDPEDISFSLDGHFLICETSGWEFYLWKKSPDGYLPHQKFVSSVERAAVVISPSGESIVSSGITTLQLWHIKNSSAFSTSFTSSISSISSASSDSSASPASPPHTAFKDFLLEFFPDKPLVAVAQWLSNTITVLNIKSGNQQLVIDTDTDTQICGMGVMGSKIIVIGDRKVITWELPVGDCVPDIQKNVNKTVLATSLEYSGSIGDFHASISPDLSYVAFGNLDALSEDLCICNIHTGKKIVVSESVGQVPGFVLSGNEVWYAHRTGIVDKWAIVKDGGSEAIQLEQLWEAEKPLSGFPWHSSCGYQVTGDGWVLSSKEKPLLCLPYHWRPDVKLQLKWNGNFLAVWNRYLPAPIILELEV